MTVKELKNILEKYDDNALVELSLKKSIDLEDWSWFELKEYKFSSSKAKELDKSHRNLLLYVGKCTME